MNIGESLQRAVAAHQRGQLAEAESLYQAVLGAQPGNADAMHFLGVMRIQQQRFDEAVALIGQAIAIRPRFPDAHCNLGTALQSAGRLDEAIACYDRAIAQQPGYVDALFNRGNALRVLGRYADALASYDAVLALKPDAAPALASRGNVLQALGRLDDAIASYDRAVAAKPDYAEAWYNRGNALHQLLRLDEAIACYDRAITVRRDFAEAHWSKSNALLLQGNFERGWKLFEWRWGRQPAGHVRRRFSCPVWLGAEPLAGKTILLHCEQGYGDTLQFCRYAPLVSALGARVVLEAPKMLFGLLRTLPGVAQLIEQGEVLPALDFHCPLLSLPLALGTRVETIPADVPYLRPDPEKVRRWQERLGPRTRPRVGLVWNGGFRPDQPETWPVNERRNVPFAKIATLRMPGIDFFSLQKGEPAESELRQKKNEIWPEGNLHDVAADLADFSDTAALIENLDLVVSVDTSTVHLAGALGKPVWLLNRFDTCWRWLLDRDDSPWYPGLRIYRQRRGGDWDAVLERVRGDLAAYADAAGRSPA